MYLYRYTGNIHGEGPIVALMPPDSMGDMSQKNWMPMVRVCICVCKSVYSVILYAFMVSVYVCVRDR